MGNISQVIKTAAANHWCYQPDSPNTYNGIQNAVIIKLHWGQRGTEENTKFLDL